MLRNVRESNYALAFEIYLQHFLKANKLIFNCNDWENLTKYVHFIKNFKKPEPYKGKGLLLKNEIVHLKEGKKSKK